MPVNFVAFDELALHGELVTAQPYRERGRLLEELRFEGPAWCTSASFEGNADAFRACIEAGLEVLMDGVNAVMRPAQRRWSLTDPRRLRSLTLRAAGQPIRMSRRAKRHSRSRSTMSSS